MADEEVKPVEEITEQKTETQEELPLAAEAEEKPEAVAASEEPKPEPVKEEPKQDWKDKELKSSYRKRKELERALVEKEAEIAARDALLAKFNQTKETETPKPVDDLIERRVQQELAQRQFQSSLSQAESKGKEVYKEGWDQAVENLQLLGGFDPDTMQGILATDDSAKVLYELGKNPDRYHQIMALPVPRRIVEMGKIAMAPSSKPVSSAPAPVNPVGGRPAPISQTVTDEMDDDKWYSIRLAQKRKRWEERNGVRR